MPKFINKKEQVIDLKLTSYGHYLMSMGSFKPLYYAFYDDNVLYDKRYADSGGSLEPQNAIHERIKNETQYFESLVLFQDVEDTIDNNTNSILGFYELDVTPTMVTPRKDIFRFDTALGDAFLDGETNVAPAWKVVMLQSEISSSNIKDVLNESLVPQINIQSNYKLSIVENSFNYDPETVRILLGRSDRFVDNKIIELTADDPMIYIDELNTQLLTENFEAEVFEVLTSSTGGIELQRKYFRRKIPQVKDGFMLSPVIQTVPIEDLMSGSVEYYFDFLTDSEVNHKIACKAMEIFNKESYYIDIDLDCEPSEDSIYYDIYGSTTTEPEICQD